MTRWLRAHRARHDARPLQRAATARTQATLVLRWFKDGTDLAVLARDAGISVATGYRYLHEAITVIAGHAPDLADVLATGTEEGWSYVCLDGTFDRGHPNPGTLPSRARRLVLRQNTTATAGTSRS